MSKPTIRFFELVCAPTDLCPLGTCGCFPLVERVFHSTQELRRKEGLFHDACTALDKFTQFRKLVTKARYKQKLRLRAICPNSRCQLNSIEPRHDNITHHKIDRAIVLLAQANCLTAIGGRHNSKPNPFKRPLQQGSKVLLVFDQQDGDLTGRYQVKFLVRRSSFSCVSVFQFMHDPPSENLQGIYLFSSQNVRHSVHHAEGTYRLMARGDQRYPRKKSDPDFRG